MTTQKHFKQLVRERMKKTGERYAAARRLILQSALPPAKGEPSAAWHFAGNIGATTALRTLLSHAGVLNPLTGKPFTEAMLFGLAGGIGIGVASFYYEKEDFASLFLAGRYRWDDDLAYVERMFDQLGLKAKVSETSGAKSAESQLRKALETGPCIAWVDMTLLPHRAMPTEMSGGGYHVITVYKIDDEGKTALIGDMTDQPISIPLADLAKARERIKKQKNRLVSIEPTGKPADIKGLVKEGLKTSIEGLTKTPRKGYQDMFTLSGLQKWGERLHGSSDKEAWERRFTPGPNLWRGLTSINQYIEYYGTGGGLCRPLFADFLSEAAEATGNKNLRDLSAEYAKLGQQWSELADAALPDAVLPFREAKKLHIKRHELLASGAPADQIRETWSQLGEMAKESTKCFPASEKHCDGLRAELKDRVLDLYAGETSALENLQKAIK